MFVAFESPFGKGVYTPRATQFKQIVIKMSQSNGFHSTMFMQSFLMGFLSVRQNRARGGLSANLFTGFLTTLRACLSFAATPSGVPTGEVGDGDIGVGVVGKGVVGKGVVGKGVVGAGVGDCILSD